MKKNFKVMVNGKLFYVEMDDQASGETTVQVNGKTYTVSLESVKNILPVVRSVQEQPALHKAALTPPVASAVLTAPMPGMILNVAVKAGDKVNRGDLLCALEAMKMKNAIRSPREAVIASVEVHDGQKVAHGDVLIKFA